MNKSTRALARGSSCICLAVLFVCWLCGPAPATIYDLDDAGWAVAVHPEWDISFVVDGYTDDAVVIQIQKIFVGELDEYGLLPAMYMEFIKTSPDAYQKIVVTDEYIINDTNVDWLDFHIEIVEADPPLAGFDPQYMPSGDQFATVALTGSKGYNGLPTKFDFSGGVVVNEPPGSDAFRPGYAYGAMVIITDPCMQVEQGFLIKEFPTVPEPATLMFLVFSAALGSFGRRRR